MILELLRDGLSWGLFIIGSILVIAGALGIWRFPDFYTRVHAAGVTDTLGAELILMAMMLQSPSWIVTAKLVFIAFFLFLTSPAATHSITHAAWVAGLKPLLGPDARRKTEGGGDG